MSILYSDRLCGLVIHACSVPFAAIEAEFYDGAFDEQHQWIDSMLGEERGEFKAWYKEAATGCRKAGLCNTPRYLLSKDSYTVLRHGVTAFTCLRSPENKAEFESIKKTIVSDLRIFPAANRELMESARKKRRVLMAFHGRTDAEMDAPREVTVPSYAERMEKADRLMSSAILTWISSIILCNAKDDAFDEQNEAIAEFHTGIKEQPGHQRVFDDVAASEVASVNSIKSKESTALAVFDDTGFTIPSVMNNMGRKYVTKCICDTKIGTTDVMEAVAKELFEPNDFTRVIDKCSSLCSSNTSVNSAISSLGKCLDERHAILVISRDQDGRISNAKLSGKDIVIPDVNRDAVSRMVLYTWLQIVIVDQDRVSILLTRDQESVSKEADFKKEKLEFYQPGAGHFAPPGSIDVSSMKAKMDEMNNQMAALKQSNESALAAVQDFKRKLDFLVEKKAEGSGEEEPAGNATSGAGSSNEAISHDALVKASETDMSIVDRLKRSLEVFVRFDKRLRKE